MSNNVGYFKTREDWRCLECLAHTDIGRYWSITYCSERCKEKHVLRYWCKQIEIRRYSSLDKEN